MLFRYSLLALAALFVVSDAALIRNPKKQHLHRRDDGGVDSSEYIVVYKAGANREAHRAWLDKQFVSASFADASTAVTTTYNFTTWFAYSMVAPEALASKVANRKGIETVMESIDYTITGVQNNAIPGLARTSSATRGGRTYSFPDSAGEGVDVYVIDTGIRTNHPEFEGRARLGRSFINNGQGGDGNGHGTHCAGTVGSRTFGIAKKASLIAVRVLDASGAGSSQTVLSGINFAIQAAAQSGRRSVISMSLGGNGNDPVTTRALDTANRNGVVVVVAAGNENQNACNVSPANVRSAITVGAIDPRTDAMAGFSNFGNCVDINAPGVNTLSTWIGNSNTPGNNGLTNSISGTSMATPHVAGVAALVLADNPTASAQAVINQILSSATTNKVVRLKPNTPNRILFNKGAAGFAGALAAGAANNAVGAGAGAAAGTPRTGRRTRQGN